MIENLKFENIYCVGRNFAGHAKELGNKIPTSPLIFQKSNSAVNIDEIIEIPSNKIIEHELEVVLLIGKDGVPKNHEEAHTFISGFSIGLDLTDRHLQTELKKKGMPWFASKTFKGSAVIDVNFINECPQEFYLMVNQKIRQEGNLKDMIFSFEDIILHLSKTIDFKKGDIIFTGTPKGVGVIESGDQIEMGFNNYPPKKLAVI